MATYPAEPLTDVMKASISPLLVASRSPWNRLSSDIRPMGASATDCGASLTSKSPWALFIALQRIVRCRQGQSAGGQSRFESGNFQQRCPMLRCAWFVNVAWLLTAPSSFGQENPSPHFEVASVKPTSGIGLFFCVHERGAPERMTYGGATLGSLIQDAYNV